MMKFNRNATRCQHHNSTCPILQYLYLNIWQNTTFLSHHILHATMISPNSLLLPKPKFEIEEIFGNKDITENNAKEMTASTMTRSLESVQDCFKSDQFQKHVNYLTLHILLDHSQNLPTGHSTCGYIHQKPC